MIRTNLFRCLFVLAAVFAAVPTLAQTSPAADVCISIDEARDTLPPQDREASVRLVARQFELADKHVVAPGCSRSYKLSHIRLGNTFMVTLTGTEGSREGQAIGLDDLPALYSQMVRSLVTGRPMTGFNVTDRNNVTVSQNAPLRFQSDSLWYARLGYGSVLGGHNQGGPAFGFGYRAEFDAMAVDVSLFNIQATPHEKYTASSGASSGSFLKIEALRFLKPKANASTYVGGGLSYGGYGWNAGSTTESTSWNGSGLQGEFTVGYEFLRASSLRLFVQADTTLPFYKATRETYSRSVGRTVGTEQRYAATLVFSVGVGWQRGR